MTEWDLTPRPVADSQVVLAEMMNIADTNVAGIVHGGTIMKLVDTAAGLAAIKHTGGMSVTVSLDEMSFLAPVHVGDVVTVKASVNDVGTTSLEVGVRVEAENYVIHERAHTSSAYLVFVAMDERGRPRPVPPVIPETDDERRRQREAKLRREVRLAHKAAIAEGRSAGGRSAGR
jgi:acyl-CoA hydrolase